MNRNKMAWVRRGILLLAGVALVAGCATSRTVTMKSVQSDSKSSLQIPLSVHLNLKTVTEESPNPVTPIAVDKESLREMIAAYLNSRSVFKAISAASPDSVLNIEVRYRMKNTAVFEYTVNMDATLVLKDGRELEKFTAQGYATGGATRFSSSSDDEPMNKAMGLAVKDLCRKIEDYQPLILVKLGRPAPVAFSEKPLTPSDIEELPKAVSGLNQNAYAIVIGIETYRQKLPKADFAANDAKLVSEYLTKTMGYPEENVILLINDKALQSDMAKYFERWLHNNVDKDSRVFVYYSGHGAPDPKTGGAYLVPYDGDPSFIAETGFSLKRMYDALGKLPSKEIVVALDSCFSGAGGRSVLAKGARPLVMNIALSQAISHNMTILSASSGEQISSTYDEKGHGLFTYFLLRGIKNKNVVNPDGSLKIEELFGYVRPQVERIARKQFNNEQTPQLIGAK